MLIFDLNLGYVSEEKGNRNLVMRKTISSNLRLELIPSMSLDISDILYPYTNYYEIRSGPPFLSFMMCHLDSGSGVESQCI